MGMQRPAGPAPSWLPERAQLYLEHVEGGTSLRKLAQRHGCHPSTMLRRIRKVEASRDDPLIDHALDRLCAAGADTGGSMPKQDTIRVPQPRPVDTGAITDTVPPAPRSQHPGKVDARTASSSRQAPAASARNTAPGPEDEGFEHEALRIMRRLAEPDSSLALAPGMESAIVVRDAPEGPVRTAVVSRGLAEALALRDWIAVRSTGRVSRYVLSATGRIALKRMLAEEGGADAPFADQHREFAAREEDAVPRVGRGNMAESPLALLARRRDRDGRRFLSPDLVAAGERLREDFELAQMGPRVTQNWDRFLTAGTQGGNWGDPAGRGPEGARARVTEALADLGPGLGDVVLRTCCYLEGMEAVERRLGWAARSGKIVLRIALQRLLRHYDEKHGGRTPLVG
ncbi:helix-turn-helix domain-containing protein [Mesobaculum littorinae]|uniref:Helix-turn-helix domain-containing protein n=1 Tax=Mesobaculum littorinae TaxID=2486419 RepID=A0A438AMG7_9RHOB|nr:DUF6456 domain-containing protein [Mesobaculum littorinae]RVV99859.1 helix-turn-helix domain-containing protein [Mesobaculum littorinae]